MIACYDISIWRMDLRGIIQFWIKTAHTVWQTGLAEELKFPRLSREKCDRSVREADVVCNNDCMEDGR